jgi:ferredoxin
MNGRVELYWFSGTGNTLLAARRVAETLRAGGVPAELRRMETADPAAVATGEGVTLGLAFPVAAFSTYALVWRFIEALPPGNGTPVFMLATMGGFSGLLVGPLKQLLQRKGYRPLAARELRMPSNFLAHAKPLEKCGNRLECGLRGADAFAQELLAGRGRWRRFSPLPYAVTRWFWTHAARSFAKGGLKFHANPARCTRCGLCVRLCPTGAITLPAAPAPGRQESAPACENRQSKVENPVPRWGGACIQCQRCIAFCPARAITGGPGASGRYRAVEAADLLDAET